MITRAYMEHRRTGRRPIGMQVMTRKLSVLIREDQESALELEAARRGIPESEIVREALDEHTDREVGL